MKKILFILFVLLVFASCNTSSRVENSALPSKCQTLEFWNGGTCIGKYEKVNVEYEMIKTTSITNLIYLPIMTRGWVIDLELAKLSVSQPAMILLFI